MKHGQVRYGLICNERGGVRDDVLVYRCVCYIRWWSTLEIGRKSLRWLAEHKGTRNVEINDQRPTTCMAAVQGPKAVEMCRDLTLASIRLNCRIITRRPAYSMASRAFSAARAIPARTALRLSSRRSKASRYSMS